MDDTAPIESERSAVGETGLPGVIGESLVMQQVYRTARRVAPSRATVLLTGDTGTGKGAVARALHAVGPRASRPFETVSCAVLADTLVESELFGHERGAFTGAVHRRIGRFERADGGTLFLDEIGELAPTTQVKLLNFLQERTIERVGGEVSMTVDVRLVAATHRDLLADVRRGRFREDLYHRLNVVQIVMPPLRLRRGDIPALAAHFLARFAAENHKAITGFTPAATATLIEAPWTGNVRALGNTVERAVVLAEGPRIDVGDLRLHDVGASPSSLVVPGSTMAEIERDAILKTMDATRSTARTAAVLGVSRRLIQYRLRAYGCQPMAQRDLVWRP